MQDEVNRLVGELLAGGQKLFLPEVGTLYTERRGARRLSSRTMQPPMCEVCFSEQQRGVPLADEIVRTTGCDAVEAKDIYDRWLARARTEGKLTIGGVGVLEGGKFTPAPEFDRRLNPQGREPLRLKKTGHRLDWAIWVGIVAVVAVIAFCAVVWWNLYRTPPAPAIVDLPVETTAIDTATHVAPADTTMMQQPVEQKTDTIQPPAPAPKPADEVLNFVSGHVYVVVGVFSTQQNARRAVVAAADLQCSICHYGSKFMVSAFDAPDAATATQFVRTHRNSYPDLWTYTAR